MSAREPTWIEVLERLSLAGVLGAAQRDLVMARLKEVAAARSEPAFARVIIGFGAWVASCLLLSALSIAGLLTAAGPALVIGVGLVAAAIVLSRLPQASVFTRQLALALGAAGNLMLLVQVGEWLSSDNNLLAVAFVQMVVCAVVYPLFRSAGYRLIAPLAIAGLLVSWLYFEHHMNLLHVVVAAEMLLVGALFLRPRLSATLEPLAIASVIALPLTVLTIQFCAAVGVGQGGWLGGMDLREYQTPLWPSSIVLGLGLIVLYLQVGGGDGRRLLGERWFRCAAAGTLVLAVFTTPGVLVALGLLVLGFSRDEKRITLLGWVFLGVFLVLYYYALDVTLAYKSVVLIGSGMLALAARWGLRRWSKREPEEAT